MNKKIVALLMTLALVLSMAGMSFASDQTDSMSGFLDMLSNAADSIGSQSGSNEDASEVVSGIADLFSGIANSAGQDADGNESASNVISGITDLFSNIAGSLKEETAQDSIDEDASVIAGAVEEDGDALDTAAGIASEDSDTEYDTLADWAIKVPVPEGVTAVYDADGYTLYITDDESIPYVRINSYGGYSSKEELADDLIRIMGEEHEDLSVLTGPDPIEIGGRECLDVVFEYGVQGYTVQDIRIITEAGSRTYMFTAKEVRELELYANGMLQLVVTGSIYLDEDTPEIETPEPQELGENELVWDMGLEEIEEYGLEGSFITFDEIGLKMWLPDILAPAEIPAEQPNQDIFLGYYETDAGDSYASVVFQPSEITLEDYKELLGSLGDLIEDADEYVINGIPCLVYFIPSGDSMCVSTIIEGQGLAEFAFAPVSEEEFGVYSELMAISIQPAD